MSSETLRRYQPTVTVPDGRVFRGRWIDSLGDSGEAPYIAELARTVRGVPEVVLPAGRADVATNTNVYEVEPVGSWRRGAQQAFAYGAMSGLQPNLALFGAADYLPIYLRIRDRMPGLTLWVWEDWDAWTLVGSRREATRKRKQAEPHDTGSPVDPGERLRHSVSHSNGQRRSFGQVRRLRSGRWQARWRLAGKWHTARTDEGGPLTFSTKRNAERYLDWLRVEIESGHWQPRSG